ncbi:MAG: MarR family transcriptional regulator [Tetrasphaera sp.]
MQATESPAAGGCPARQGAAFPSAPDELAYQLVRVAKLIRSVRTTAPRAHWAVDANAYPLLFNLCGDPIRISALAERTHLEVSTVSRHVSGLERDGIVRRIPDPADRRAQLVTLTAEGQAALRALQEQRQGWFADLLAEWDAADVTQLIDLLTRFGDTVETRRAEHGRAAAAHDDTPFVKDPS